MSECVWWWCCEREIKINSSLLIAKCCNLQDNKFAFYSNCTKRYQDNMHWIHESFFPVIRIKAAYKILLFTQWECILHVVHAWWLSRSSSRIELLKSKISLDLKCSPLFFRIERIDLYDCQTACLNFFWWQVYTNFVYFSIYKEASRRYLDVNLHIRFYFHHSPLL